MGRALDDRLDRFLTSALVQHNFSSSWGESLSIYVGRLGLKSVTFIGLGDGTEMDSPPGWRDLGGQVYKAISSLKGRQTLLLDHGKRVVGVHEADQLALGIRLGSYDYNIYKSKRRVGFSGKITIGTVSASSSRALESDCESLASGVFLARDLVNAPGIDLGPKEFSDYALSLRDKGCTVKVLDSETLLSMGCGGLLAVGGGSSRPPCMVVVVWKGPGVPTSRRPLLLVGKGIVFDSGGLSIKPSSGMEEMKGDMGGAAAVLGTLDTLSSRRSASYVVGVIALAENLPSSTSYRPGDVIRSASGQTIEVLNTDAEGRVVLADALWYAQEHFAPKTILSLATLTGAIMVALGHHRAGLFTRRKSLVDRLMRSGRISGDLLWPMPLEEAYDRLIDSDIADVKNVGSRYGGAITAAQFLDRFVKVPSYAHLDIAGTAFGGKRSAVSPSWGTGFGVQLLDHFVRAHHE